MLSASELQVSMKRWRRSVLAVTVILVPSLGIAMWRQYATAAAVEGQRVLDSLDASVRFAKQLKAPLQIAVFDDEQNDPEATRELIRILDSDSRCEWEFIASREILAGRLIDFNTVVFPGGNAKQQAAALGVDGRQAIRDFVSDGGGFVGICAGAFLATCYADWSLALVDAQALTGNVYVAGQGMMSMSARSAGVVQMEFSLAGKRLFDEMADLVDVRYRGGPILSQAGRADLADFVTLAVYRTEVWDFEAQRGTMRDTPAVVASRLGKGNVVLISPHLEMTRGLESLVMQCLVASSSTNRSFVELTPSSRDM